MSTTTSIPPIQGAFVKKADPRPAKGKPASAPVPTATSTFSEAGSKGAVLATRLVR